MNGRTSERRRFFRFAVVGTIGAAVDFGVFNLLIQVFGIRPVWANVGSFSVAVVSNFIWNRYWTYPDSRTKRIRFQLAQFFVVNLVGVGMGAFLVSSLILQTLLTRKAPSGKSESKSKS